MEEGNLVLRRSTITKSAQGGWEVTSQLGGTISHTEVDWSQHMYFTNFFKLNPREDMEFELS